MESDWILIKRRNADVGSVWRSADGALFKRTGDVSVRKEAAFQRSLFNLGFPVPEVVAEGVDDGLAFFVERSLGAESLHEIAAKDTSDLGRVRETTIDAAIAVSAELQAAQAKTARPAAPGEWERWCREATFIDNVFQENPGFDNDRTRNIIGVALDRLRELPLCPVNLDYGLPNAFPAGVIDWQHHAVSPIGFDVYPMLHVVDFHGVDRAYRFTDAQRRRYLTELDEVSLAILGQQISGHLSNFLLLKCFFFLAFMKPDADSKPSKRRRWELRTRLLARALTQYDKNRSVDLVCYQ